MSICLLVIPSEGVQFLGSGVAGEVVRHNLVYLFRQHSMIDCAMQNLVHECWEEVFCF